MIRKVYLDLLRRGLSEGSYGWLLHCAERYVLVWLSHAARRPLCGPILGTLVTNYTCNLHCSMCDISSRKGVLEDRGLRELSTSEMRGIIDGLASLGTLGVGFTGGEPLLRPDIYELLAHARSRGMITHLNSNGFLLGQKNAEEILAVGVDSLNISLDGARAATHDAIRGMEGCFSRAKEAVRLVDRKRQRGERKLRLKVVCVVQERNVEELPDLARLSAELGADCVEFVPRQPFAYGEVQSDTAAGEDFMERLGRALREIGHLRREGIAVENSKSMMKLLQRAFRNLPSPIPCYAGYNSLAVDCYGEVYPCLPWANWDRAVGHVTEEKELKEFWHSRAYQESRREVDSCRRCSLNCQAELNLLFSPMKRV
jgi:MoaA/NifB/PqqE/SkfB family radical SAM enzyme